MSQPSVFISYCHKDEIWKERVKPQLDALEMADQIVFLKGDFDMNRDNAIDRIPRAVRHRFRTTGFYPSLRFLSRVARYDEVFGYAVVY